MRGVLGKAAAPYLILLTPFIVFLQYHGYPFADPGALICLLALALLALALGATASISPVLEVVVIAGSLTLLADLQFHPPKGVIGLAVIFLGLVALLWVFRRHAVRIVTVATAAMLLSSILLPTRSVVTRADQPAAATRHGDGPLIVHLILDEQIGIEGFPADISPPAFRAQLRAFFVDRGFLLFGRAFSEYFKTYRSIAALVNFKPGEFVKGLLVPGRTGLPWDLTQNVYFARLTDAGYAIQGVPARFPEFLRKPGADDQLSHVRGHLAWGAGARVAARGTEGFHYRQHVSRSIERLCVRAPAVQRRPGVAQRQEDTVCRRGIGSGTG